MEYLKFIRRQDCNWKKSAGPSGETSLNLSNEICSFLTFGLIDKGEESVVTFHIYRADFEEAIHFIGTQLPLFRSSSRESWEVSDDDSSYTGLSRSLDNFFGNETEADYTVTIYRRGDSRIYLKGLKQFGFTIRDYLVENSTAIKFILSEKGIELRIYSAVTEGDNI